MYDLKIVNGTVVHADGTARQDILVRDGRVAALGDASDCEARESIDAEGMLLFPGMLDCHAHLNDPGFTWREDFPHGSAAAALGGVTTVIDMPLQNEPALTTAALFEAKEKALRGRSAVDYAFWGGLVPENLGDMKALHRAGAVAFKCFLGPVSPDYSTLNLGLARKALEIAAEMDALIGFHCEEYSIIKAGETAVLEKYAGKSGKAGWRDYLDSRPLSAELVATYAVVEMAREIGARAHICHVSHPDVAELIRRARADGVRVSGETCGHYLVFSDADLLENGALFKCAPPLREPAARDRLWEYVADGTLSCLGSDHSPCRADEKDEAVHGVMGAWGGISGIQSLMQVVYDRGVVGRGVSPCLLARASAETARVFSLAHAKGAIRPGLDADIVMLDPCREWEITADSLAYVNPISAFVGVKGRGLPVATLVRGVVAMRDGGVTADYKHGGLVKRG